MKNGLIKISLLSIMGAFFAFTSIKSDKKLIGSWKVETVKLNDGTTKDGRKTLTFFSDKSFASTKDNGSEMKGHWKLENNSELLKMSDESKEKWVEFQIIKLTKSKLVIKDDRKTYFIIKAKPNKK